MDEAATISRLPVSELVKRQLGRRLGEEWSAGDRLPPLDELARMIGAGQRNTHRALRELVDEGFLVARPGVGTFVAGDLKADAVRLRFGDQPRSRMLQPSGRLRGKTVTLFVHATLPGSPSAEVMEPAQAALLEQGAAVHVKQFSPHEVNLHFEDPQSDGFLIALYSLRVKVTFDAAKVACFVRTGEVPPVAMPGRYDIVHPNGEQGGFLAGEHLRKLGYTRAAFIGRRSLGEPTRVNTISMNRLAGFQLGFGQTVPEDCQLLAERYDDRAAAKLVPSYLAMPDRPPVIFAATDDLALGFIVGASSHGLEVGRDYQIIGFDAQTRGRDIFGGPLTTIDVLRPELARQAVRLLADRLLDPDLPVRQIAHGCRLVPGGTVRPHHFASEGNAP